MATPVIPCVMLGTAALIITLSILDGFEREIKNKVVEFTAHVQVQGYQNLPLVTFLSALAYRFTGQWRVGRFRRLREELLSVLRGTSLMGLFVVAATFGLQHSYESRGAFLLFFALTVFLMLAARRAS